VDIHTTKLYNKVHD